MTAPIYIAAGSQLTLAEAGIAEFEFGGDEHTTSPNRHASTRNVPGSLWERIADATINDDALTAEQWGRMAAMRSTLGTHRTGGVTYDGRERGELLAKFGDAYLGAIKAGRLIRVTEIHRAPYVHTGFEAGAL